MGLCESSALKLSHNGSGEQLWHRTAEAPALVSATSHEQFFIVPSIEIGFPQENCGAIS